GHLRANLASLRRGRAGVRRVVAWSALASSVFVALAAVFLLDVLFELAVVQRIVVLLLAAAAVGWAFFQWSWPFLGRPEDDIELVLLVERHYAIDRDLVAALEFDQGWSPADGSPSLAAAVVDRVAT